MCLPDDPFASKATITGNPLSKRERERGEREREGDEELLMRYEESKAGIKEKKKRVYQTRKNGCDARKKE